MATNMTAVMDQLRRKQEAAEAEYHALTLSMAEGEAIGADVVLEVLTAAGKTTEQFGQDVAFRTPVRPVKGKFILTEAPGLGLELDEAELRRRAIPWGPTAATT